MRNILSILLILAFVIGTVNSTATMPTTKMQCQIKQRVVYQDNKQIVNKKHTKAPVDSWSINKSNAAIYKSSNVSIKKPMRFNYKGTKLDEHGQSLEQFNMNDNMNIYFSNNYKRMDAVASLTKGHLEIRIFKCSLEV